MKTVRKNTLFFLFPENTILNDKFASVIRINSMMWALHYEELSAERANTYKTSTGVAFLFFIKLDNWYFPMCGNLQCQMCEVLLCTLKQRSSWKYH